VTTPPRRVHVLFVHGVGQHSRLSALLRPYQAFRSSLRSAEAPTTVEDLIPDWRLEELSEDAETPYLKLTPKPNQPRPPEAVYFYEVNYSVLAGIIRGNQPLDITQLFVGLDLAINVARQRVLSSAPAQTAAIARIAQRLVGVLVATTAPILGLPSLLLRSYTGTFVAQFTRFFADVATFAIDKNGDKLISAHVDKTIENIVNSEQFGFDSELVIAAHSLGTVVMHNYLVRQWSGSDKRVVPARLLTFGSPIGLVCWMWLFLDYGGGRLDPRRATGRNYFSWDPLPGAAAPARSVLWINVVNHLDPIATAFPPEHVDLIQPPGAALTSIVGGSVEHRYIKLGGALSVGGAHTDYINDREGFLEIAARLAYLRSGDPRDPAKQRSAGQHWENALWDLRRLRVGLWLLGVVCLSAYLWVIAKQFPVVPIVLLLNPLTLLQPLTVMLLILYAWPRAMIELLAFFQRLEFGGPTKRTAAEQMGELPWRDLASFPYRLRRLFRLGLQDPDPEAPRAGLILRSLGRTLSFVPTAVLMVIPIAMARELRGSGPGPVELIRNHPTAALILLVLFLLYVVAFALSEFFGRWRALIVELTRPAALAMTPPSGTPGTTPRTSTPAAEALSERRSGAGGGGLTDLPA
jgi:hypothetical protein